MYHAQPAICSTPRKGPQAITPPVQPARPNEAAPPSPAPAPAPWRSGSPPGHTPGRRWCTCPAGMQQGGAWRQQGSLRLNCLQPPRLPALPGGATEHPRPKDPTPPCSFPLSNASWRLPSISVSMTQGRGAQVGGSRRLSRGTRCSECLPVGCHSTHLWDVTVPQQLHAEAILVVPAGQQVQESVQSSQQSATAEAVGAPAGVALAEERTAQNSKPFLRGVICEAHLMVLSMSPTRYTACSMRRSSCDSHSLPAAACTGAAILRAAREAGR